MEDVRKTLAAQAGLLTELLTHATEPVLRTKGIGFATFELLSAVRAAGHHATQTEIAGRLGITPPTLTEAIKTAVARGFIVQGPNRRDQRSKSLQLTKQGEAIVMEVIGAVNLAEKAMVEGIDPVSLNTAIETLREVNRNLARSLNRETA